ncbi:acyl-CoA dehydrogenase family protein [Dermatobacter hominis]|uniref:acyl-CoA dehydrogenase family protein n=1 Tax=Dermatobacter hominis TaxID=2884263 RepID=UPI001D118279|nr:acyl-CoA dehydrogenase family protein [Dermatobacter hominis]UDY36680.1 acyl-CoA dehydrogenase family protein [Dermatobacter hominis]
MVDVERFRAEVREFLDARYVLLDPLADDRREDIISRTPDGEQAFVDDAVALQRELAAAGLAAVHVPVEYGGRGLTPEHQKVVEAELRRYDAPSLRPLRIGMHLALATLLRSASDEQKARYVPPLVRAEEQWCQLFSEPDAGSDLVALRTRGVRDVDGWVLDGQKVWSSYAARADFGLLLARTDPDAPKPQAGITMFVLPMGAAGVTVRPLVDITGGRHFNEVFLEGVRVRDDDVIGEVHGGWSVSQGTLGGERSGYMGGSGGGRRRRQVVRAATRTGRLDDPVLRQRIAKVVTTERVLEWVRDRYVGGTLCDGHPAAGSMMKLIGGSLEQECAELIADIAGPAGQAWSPDDRDGDVVAHDLNATRQARIAGGTHEIQRNLLGERVLGLPRQPA